MTTSRCFFYFRHRLILFLRHQAFFVERKSLWHSWILREVTMRRTKRMHTGQNWHRNSSLRTFWRSSLSLEKWYERNKTSVSSQSPNGLTSEFSYCDWTSVRGLSRTRSFDVLLLKQVRSESHSATDLYSQVLDGLKWSWHYERKSKDDRNLRRKRHDINDNSNWDFKRSVKRFFFQITSTKGSS